MEEKKKNKKISIVHYLLGCRFDVLVRLLAENKFKIAKEKIPQTIFMLLLSLILFPFALIEELYEKIFVYHKKIEKEPLFILGFWRSGTTYLQDILCLDENYSYIDTVKTYTSNNSILLKRPLRAIMKKYANEFRFMDNVKNDVDSPCEEEFAMADKTTKSLVHLSTFVKNADYYKDFILINKMSEKEQKKWKKIYEHFIKKVYFLNKEKPLILKSPDNTGHSAELAEMFPNSKFVYIYRNPYKIICSFKHTINCMIEHFSLQGTPTEEEVEDIVIDIYKNTMTQYRIDKEKFKDKLIEIKYEDFVKNPMPYLEKIYTELEIGDFEKMKPIFEEYINSKKDYKTNTYEIPDRLKKKIQDNLGEFFEEYGYEM